jgi:hypothetical protein
MELDLHVSRFDWVGGAAGIGRNLADLAQRAETTFGPAMERIAAIEPAALR